MADRSSRPVVDLSNLITAAPQSRGFYYYSRSKAGIALAVLFYLVVTILPILMFLPPTMLLSFMAHWVARRFLDYCVASWMTFVSFTFEYVFGIKTGLSGYSGRFKKRSLIIMNHVSHLDWLFFWAVVMRRGDLTTWKVVTKNNIRNLPAVGQCMQLACLLFISRSWEKDEPEFRDKLDYFNSLDYPCQLLLFPEGRDFTKTTKAASDKFAEQNDLPKLDYCLHPRQKGFTYIMDKLREQKLDAIYDVTIAFPDAMPKTEVDFVNEVMPRQVDFHIKSYTNSELPLDEKSLGEWCQQRFLEKDELLHSYYTNKSFDKSVPIRAVSSERDSQSFSMLSAVLWLLALNVVAGFLVMCVGWLVSLVWCFASLVLIISVSYTSMGLDGLLLKIHKRATQKYLDKKQS